MSPSGLVTIRQKPAMWAALLASIAVRAVSPPDLLPQRDAGGDGYQASREVLRRLFARLTRWPAAIPGLREGRLLVGHHRPSMERWGGTGERHSIEPRNCRRMQGPRGGQVVVRSTANSEAAERAIGIIQRLHCFGGHHRPRLHRWNNFSGETGHGFRFASEVQPVSLNGMAVPCHAFYRLCRLAISLCSAPASCSS
jgi:hypothetical protein